MAEESVSEEFRLKNIDETRNYLDQEIEQNELMRLKKFMQLPILLNTF